MPSNSWYHEIVLCGTDKVAMGVTSLTKCNHKRANWMLPFESYFGLSIKFINPVLLIWILFNNLMEDLSEPYLDQNFKMYIFSTLFVFIALGFIIVSLFICSYPEVFEHNVNLEFLADNLYEIKLRMSKYFKDQISNTITNNVSAGLAKNLNLNGNNSLD